MTIINASPDNIIQLGWEGEDRVTVFRFRYGEDWVSNGNGIFSVRVLRNGENQAYNAQMVLDDRENHCLLVTLTAVELSKKGTNEMQVVYSGEDFIKKSPVYRYYVSRSVDEAVDPPAQDVYTEIIESLSELGEDIGDIQTDVRLIEGNIGNLADLTTTAKTDLVSAINEVNAKGGGSGGGGSVTVDDALSTTSTNPVQNKVVNARFDGVDQTVAGIGGRLATAETALEGKANTADVNTALSTKANISDVNTALSGKADKSYVDTQLAGKASTATATTSADGLMSAQDKVKLETMIQRVASGAPIVVTSVSAMTDTDQIYVLSTNGQWYYHNSSAWVAGGEYGGVAVGSITTDKLADGAATTAKIADGAVTAEKIASGVIPAIDTALTQTGMAADAKAAGDAITEVKADLDTVKESLGGGNLFDKTDYSIYHARIQDDTGYIVTTDASQEMIIVPVDSNTTYAVGKAIGSHVRVGSGGVDEPPHRYKCTSYVDNYQESDLTKAIVISTGDNDHYLYISMWSNSDPVDKRDATIYIDSLYVSKEIDISDFIDSKQCIELLGRGFGESPRCSYFLDYDGRIDSDGTTIMPSNYRVQRYSDYIPVLNGENIIIVLSVPYVEGRTTWLAYSVYDQSKNVVVGRTVITANTISDGYMYSIARYTVTADGYMRIMGDTYGDGIFALYATSDTDEIQIPRQQLKKEIIEASVEKAVNESTSIIRPLVGYVTRYDDVCLGINHRGYNTAPENTIPAYIESYRHGFRYVECDVKLTSDGEFVLLHDATINRTARNADGTAISETTNITDITYEQALEFDFGIYKSSEYAGTKIPLLSEFLLFCRKVGLHPYLELKFAYTEATTKAVVDMVRAHGMSGKVTYISASGSFLRTINAYDPTARLGIVTELPTSEAVNLAVELKNDSNFVFIDADRATDEAVNICKQSNIPMEVWIVTANKNTILSTNPYVTGFTHDYLHAGKVMYEDAMGEG